MSIVEGLILGILQGVTEFLPVSSSGHLCLMQFVFGMSDPEQYVFFDLVLHMGTLLAVVIVFRASILRILLSERLYILYMFLAVCALAPFAFLVPFLKSFYGQPRYLGFFFIITSMLLLMGELAGKRASNLNLTPGKKALHCILIGMSQVIAILPGVSRSGTTVSVARMLGWKPSEAAEFSFLIVIPVVLAGSVFEGRHLFDGSMESVPEVGVGVYAAGFISAFIVGLFALKLFLVLLDRGKFMYFVIYCAVLGMLTLAYFNLWANL